MLLLHGIELEDGVEVHKLYASDVIDLLLRDDMLQIVVHRLEGDGVTVGTRIAEYGVILADKHEVNSPGINTDTGNLQSATSHLFQALDDFKIECIDIPVIVSTLNNQVIGEAGHLFEFEGIIFNSADDGSTAGGT